MCCAFYNVWIMLQMLLPIQLPTSWDAVFIEFSLAHFLWLSYQPTRASSFLKYSANLKEESRFWETIWFFPQAFQRTAQIVDHWGFVKLEFCETWSILWKQKIENSFSSAHVCLPLLLRNEGLFPVLTWRQYSMERSWRYWNCLSQTFFHSAQGLSIPKWCFLGNIFSRKTWRMSEMGDRWDNTAFISYHFVAIELLVQYHQQGLIVVKYHRLPSWWWPSSTPVV